jgi:hypothetical protein
MSSQLRKGEKEAGKLVAVNRKGRLAPKSGFEIKCLSILLVFDCLA